MKLKRIFKMHRIFIVQELKKQMEYKVDFLIGVGGFFLAQASTILFLGIIFGTIPDLAGWSFNEILFIYGFSLIPKGIDHVFFDRLWFVGGRMIRMGQFDTYLTRPINPLIHVLMEQFQVDGFGEVIVGISLIVWTAPQIAIEWSIVKILLWLLALPFCILIFTAIKTVTSALAFWVKNSQSVIYMFYMVNDFSKYPVTIYNRFIQTVVTFVIPFALTAFYPASYILRGGNVWFCIGMPMIVAVVLMTVAVFVWNQGVKVYESAGS
ncbi:MAG: ABC-2 family transporter protein [Oscillospiraceae bacterium]|jgi:ABC-2 type transport system permease protein|nr:ABC-2 family transporter protein [Oscillospiraceae bacterium]